MLYQSMWSVDEGRRPQAEDEGGRERETTAGEIRKEEEGQEKKEGLL